MILAFDIKARKNIFSQIHKVKNPNLMSTFKNVILNVVVLFIYFKSRTVSCENTYHAYGFRENIVYL